MRNSLMEKFKTAILIILIVTSLSLTYRLWFNDHNLFSIFGFSNYGENILKDDSNFEYVNSPFRILVNTGETSHALIRPFYEEYSSLRNEGTELIKKSLEVSKFENIDKSEWNKLLSSRSVLFSYNTGLELGFLAKTFKISSTNMDFSSFNVKDFIIVEDSVVTNNIKIYLRNDAEDKVIKSEFPYDDSKLSGLLASIEGKSYNNYFMGFEVNHKAISDGVLLSSELDLDAAELRLVKQFDLDILHNTQKIEEKFFDNYNLVKKKEYENADKTKISQRILMDRKGILKLSDNGLIQYKSSEVPDETVQNDAFKALEIAFNFINSKNLDFPKDAYISEIIPPSGNSGYRFAFDYTIEGIRVKISGKDLPEHAIEIEVKGNTVTDYESYVKGYKSGKHKGLTVSNLEAIDTAVEQYRKLTGANEKEKSIRDIKLVYVDDGEEKDIYPSWDVSIGDKEISVSGMNGE